VQPSNAAVEANPLNFTSRWCISAHSFSTWT